MNLPLLHNRPIGIFDSGIGGLTVWRELYNQLPNESSVYFADTKNCPYGDKSPEEVYKYSKSIVEFLINKGCKLIVIACNTATGVAINKLREEFPLPFVGMEPAIKPAANISNTGVIGVLATSNTFKSNHFNSTKAKYTSNVETVTQPGHGLVEYIEKGDIDSDELRALLSKYITPMLNANVDELVLGCSHYPFLSTLINSITNNSIRLHNPAIAIVKRVSSLLQENRLASDNDSTHTFYTSQSNANLVQLEELLTSKLDIPKFDSYLSL